MEENAAQNNDGLEAFKKLQEDLKKANQLGQQTSNNCPNCGYCPTCGRRNYYNNPPFYPPYTITC